ERPPAPLAPQAGRGEAREHRGAGPKRSNTSPPRPAPMIGAIPNPIVAASDWPVEYRFDGSMRPITTTIVVNSNANPAPSNTVKTDRTVGSSTRPHSRKPVAYRMGPATTTARSQTGL